MRGPDGRILLGGATVVVVAAVVAGIIVLGAPSEERARRLDARRVTDLRQLSQAIVYYHQQRDRLPASLEELSTFETVNVATRDPVRGDTYGFHVVDATRFEVCATFDRSSQEERATRADEFWAHRAGVQCFTRSVPGKPQ